MKSFQLRFLHQNSLQSNRVYLLQHRYQHNTGEWTKNYGSAATERKIYVGKGIRYFSNIGVAEFLVEAAELNVGDKLLITGPTTGAVFTTLDEARVDLKPVQTVKKGQHFSMKADKIRPSDKLYKLVSTEELKKFKGLDIEKTRG